MNTPHLIDRYVAVWNEGDARERRRLIRALWAPDGATCNRLLDARGYDAIEARVAGSWEKSLSTGNHVFRPRRAVGHHDVLKFDWVMARTGDGTIAGAGLSFLVLAGDGRIQADYQFNPAVNDAGPLVERYVAVWNERDALRRRRAIADLWAPDAVHLSEGAARSGRAQIEAEASGVSSSAADAGLVFETADRSQAHHDVLAFTWQQRRRSDRTVTAMGAELLILDAAGQIRFDCCFEEPLIAVAGAVRAG
jgi:SnoaL-like domain